MAEVQPFRGLRYHQGKAGDLSLVLCPPYDIISPEEAKLYRGKSPYNAVRIELDKAYHPATTYQQAHQTLQNWLEEEMLLLEPQPAFYVVECCFEYQNRLRNRWELVGRVRLATQGDICPHETVLTDPLVDRLQLLRSCQLNSSPLLGVVRQGIFDYLTQLVNYEPNLSVADSQGVTYRMWVISDLSMKQEITSLLGNKVIYLADGHHRYQAALAYRKERLSIPPDSNGREGFNFIMMSLIDAEDPGVVLLPLHRLVQLPQSVSLSRVRKELKTLFYLEAVASRGSNRREDIETWLNILAQQENTFGLYGLDGSKFALLIPRNQTAIEEMMPQEYSQCWRELTTTILHRLILPSLLRIEPEERLEYTTDSWEAISRVDSGEFQLAFLLNSPPLSSMLAIAEAGEKMVPKSTFFYPKPPAGLVMNPLWD